jgi:hypothetical protein
MADLENFAAGFLEMRICRVFYPWVDNFRVDE